MSCCVSNCERAATIQVRFHPQGPIYPYCGLHGAPHVDTRYAESNRRSN